MEMTWPNVVQTELFSLSSLTSRLQRKIQTATGESEKWKRYFSMGTIWVVIACNVEPRSRETRLEGGLWWVPASASCTFWTSVCYHGKISFLFLRIACYAATMLRSSSCQCQTDVFQFMYSHCAKISRKDGQHFPPISDGNSRLQALSCTARHDNAGRSVGDQPPLFLHSRVRQVHLVGKCKET